MCALNPKLGGILLLVLGLLLAACTREGGDHTAARQKGSAPADTLRVSQRNEPSDLDPALATLPDEYMVIRALAEGLLSPAPGGGEPIPAAASSFVVSPDGLTYTFTLRADARWSNGDPVTAGDFVSSYRRLLTPLTAAPKAHLFYAVKGAQAFNKGINPDFGSVGFHAEGPRTLKVVLERTLPTFAHLVASGAWIPSHPATVASHGRAWTRPGNHVGNGPYTLEEWSPGRHITVRRRAGYHAAASVSIELIQFRAMDNGEAEERAFRAGQLDITMAVPVSKLPSYRDQVPPVLRHSALLETRCLAFNTLRGPLSDTRVRRALALSLDRARLVGGVLLGGQQPARTLVPHSLLGGPARDVEESPETARKLLADAGFPEGRGFPRLELSGWTNQALMEAVQAMWRKELGIEVGIVTRDARVHMASLRSGQYDIGMAVCIPDAADPALILEEFNTKAPGNLPQWADCEYVQLLRNAETAPTPFARAAHLADAERRLLSEMPVAPLYFNARNYLVHPRVSGWVEDGLWNRHYVGVTLLGELSPQAE